MGLQLSGLGFEVRRYGVVAGEALPMAHGKDVFDYMHWKHREPKAPSE
uniref:Uncharacterized protein n=1 Tax=Dromaius novaehollandiae TaxID=8790 RepID=A0A8C4J1I3_DRONO